MKNRFEYLCEMAHANPFSFDEVEIRGQDINTGTPGVYYMCSGRTYYRPENPRYNDGPVFSYPIEEFYVSEVTSDGTVISEGRKFETAHPETYKELLQLVPTILYLFIDDEE